MPDAVENRLAQLGYQNDVSAWEIGWITTWIFDYCTVTDRTGKRILINRETEEPIKSYELYNAIAKATQVKSPHSVRNWHGVAKHISPGLKDNYPLGLSHWKAIIPHCKDEKDLRKMADIVVSWADDYNGVIISVAALRHKLAGEDGGPAAWEKRLKTATRACKNLAKDEAAPAFIRSASKAFITRTIHPPLP